MRPLLLSVLFLSSLSARPPSREGKEQEIVDTPPLAKRFTIRHIEPQGVGYHQGYTTLDFFVALASPPNFIIPFVDVRGHIFDHGHPAVNAGFGLRFLTSSWVFGANSYFDYRKTEQAPYTQVGVGCEMLGKMVDIRLNGYFPVGNTKSDVFHTQFSHFRDHYAILKSRYEFSMIGLNAEVGAHITEYKNAKCYAALGPYYFTGQGKNAIGGSARLSGTFYEYLQIEASGSYDPVFKWIGQGQIGLVFSFGPTKSTPAPRCTREPLLWQRTVQPVERNEIIVLDRTSKETLAIDPLTKDPYFFWFVNNTSHSQGTFESPFPTLAEAESASNPGDIIYVFPGDGTSAGMDAGITLKDNQRFWGSGVPHLFETSLGTMTVTQYTTILPVIRSLMGDGITLAQNNEVSGVALANCDSGIYGYNPGHVRILSSTFSNNGVGIYLEPADSSSVTIDNSVFTEHVYAGIRVYAEANALADITVDNSVFTESGYDGIKVQVYNDAQTNLTVENSVFTGNGDGIDVELYNNAQANITIDHSSFTANTGEGIDVDLGDDAQANITVSNSVFTENILGGIYVAAEANALADITVDNSVFTAHAWPGVDIESFGANIQGTIHDNVFQDNNDYGLYIYQEGSGTVCWDVTGNTATGNVPGNYLWDNQSGTMQVSPCSAEALNSGGLFDHVVNSGTFQHVESCSSGMMCPP